MSFYATSFIFDGVPSEEYGLIVCNLDGDGQEAGRIGTVSVQEDRIARRHDALHYGAVQNEALSFPLTFLADERTRTFDRHDIASIAGWLTGHRDYKRLCICQPDMENVFFRCMITELEVLENAMLPIGFTATVTCDGPFAYRQIPDTVCSVHGGAQLLYRNLSNVNDYYFPAIQIACSGSAFLMENVTDHTTFRLENMPAGDRVLKLDCKNQVMTSSDGLNLYAHWNPDGTKSMPRMLRGDNQLSFTGNGTVTIQNTFPWSIGY